MYIYAYYSLYTYNMKRKNIIIFRYQKCRHKQLEFYFLQVSISGNKMNPLKEELVKLQINLASSLDSDLVEEGKNNVEIMSTGENVGTHYIYISNH